jgi:hypothetical protein
MYLALTLTITDYTNGYVVRTTCGGETLLKWATTISLPLCLCTAILFIRLMQTVLVFIQLYRLEVKRHCNPISRQNATSENSTLRTGVLSKKWRIDLSKENTNKQ